MENKLNPLQIFQSAGIADSFLPVDFGMKDVLFWRVPELLEKNAENKRAKEVTPGPQGKEHEFYQKRRDAFKAYTKQNMLSYVGDKMKLDPDHRDLYFKVFKLIENSSMGRIGAHLAGLYLDCSKVPQLFELPIEEQERIVDNNLVLANVACIYAGFAENFDEDGCEQAKKLFEETKNLIANPKIHLKPLFLIGIGKKDENGYTRIVEELRYAEDDKNLVLEPNETKFTLQADLVNQFNAIANKKETSLNSNSLGSMLWMQRIVVKNAESKQRQQKTKKQQVKALGE